MWFEHQIEEEPRTTRFGAGFNLQTGRLSFCSPSSPKKCLNFSGLSVDQHLHSVCVSVMQWVTSNLHWHLLWLFGGLISGWSRVPVSELALFTRQVLWSHTSTCRHSSEWKSPILLVVKKGNISRNTLSSWLSIVKRNQRLHSVTKTQHNYQTNSPSCFSMIWRGTIHYMRNAFGKLVHCKRKPWTRILFCFVL